MRRRTSENAEYVEQACQTKSANVDVRSFLYSDLKKHGRVVVTNTSAQFARQCTAASSRLSEYESNCNDLLLAIRDIPSLFAYVSLLLRYGLRVSEMLHCNCADMIDHDVLRIKGAKGSCDRVVSVLDGKVFFRQMYKVDYQLSYDYNRYYVYRLFKRFGIYEVFGTNNKYSVTHIARHMIMLKYKDKGLTSEELCRVLGHKNVKSLSYYLQDVKSI